MALRRKGLRLVRHKNRNGWYVRGVALDGKPVNKACGTDDETEARAFLIRYEASLLESRGPVEAIGFLRAAVEYLEADERSRDQKRYVNALARHFGAKRIHEIGQPEIDRAARQMYPDATNETRNRQVYTPTIAVLRFMAKSYRGYTAPTIERPKQKKREPRPMRPEDVAKILDAARADAALYAFLLILFSNGPRVTEATSIDWSHVDMAGRHFDIHETKTDSRRRCYMSDEVFMALANLPGEREGRVFPYADRHDVYAALATLDDLHGFTPHRARHTFATTFLEQYGDLALAMKAGGWKSVGAFSIYAHIGDDRVRAATQGLDLTRANSGATFHVKQGRSKG